MASKIYDHGEEFPLAFSKRSPSRRSVATSNGNGDPGWLTLARGYADLIMLTAGWELAKLQQARDQ